MVDKQMGEPPRDSISMATAPPRKSPEDEFTPADSGTFTLASVLHSVGHVSVYVHVCTLVDTPVCVHERVCIHVCLWLCVHVGCMCMWGPEVDIWCWRFFVILFIETGLIVNPELASSASLACQPACPR